MRIFFAAVAMMALSGCTEHDTQRAAASRPTITFRLDNLAEFEQADRSASGWCRRHHGRDARFVASSDAGDSEAVTFECIGR